METDATAREQHHIVMLPFMAHGHLNPFLALSKQIHTRYGFRITIATTPLNVLYLKSAIAKDYTIPPDSDDERRSDSLGIRLSELSFDSSDHGLPPNTENTEALSLDRIVKLFLSTVSLAAPFQRLLADVSAEDGRPPLCVISDVFMGWADEVSRSCGTRNVSFTTGGAYGTAAYVSLWQHLPHRVAGKDVFNLPGFPDSTTFHVTQLHRFLRAADGTDSWSRFFQPQIANSLKSFGWLCNSAAEIEDFGLDILRRYTNRPVWCIGPLLPPKMVSRKPSRLIGQHTGKEPRISPEKCIEWLDLKPESSVLYVSFGSQNTISSSQMMALAMGLEESEKPFIWVVRPPVGFSIRDEFQPEWLPEGFEERTARSNQGLVVHGWAPQLEILCHRSTAAFVSHCGWNSIVESLSQGVPIIGWPMAAEQGYNAKMLVEVMGVCVELTRGVESSISKEHVKEVIEVAMGEGDRAGEMRKKAGQIGELIRQAVSEKGSSHEAMDDFISTVLLASKDSYFN